MNKGLMQKVMTPLEARQTLKKLKEHCEVISGNFSEGNKDACLLCPINEFCSEQFGHDLPRNWELPSLNREIIKAPRD